jgi:diadenosine tetraphosphate (Ap4A) HIT family hydrolase
LTTPGPVDRIVAVSDPGNCVFCQLIRRDREVSVVREDAVTVVFMDIEPIVRGHMLVVPRRHVAGLAALEPEEGAELFRVAQIAAAVLRASPLRCEGVNLWLGDGKAAFQDVFHVHLHVIPRHRGDGFDLVLPPGLSVRPRAELDETAAILRQAWQSDHGTGGGELGSP